MYYYFQDQIGTSRLIANSSGTVCYDADLTPFGYEMAYTTSCSQNYKFTGMDRDSETGNDHAWFRFYENNLGRWMSPDPLAGDLTNPQSLNRYAYVVDNPTSLVDPLGLCPPGTHPATPQEAQQIVNTALGMLRQGITYRQCDCTCFINRAIFAAGYVLPPYATTAQIYNQTGPGAYFQPASSAAVGDVLLFGFPGHGQFSHAVLATNVDELQAVGSQTSTGPAVIPPPNASPGQMSWYENLLGGAKAYQICLPDNPNRTAGAGGSGGAGGWGAVSGLIGPMYDNFGSGGEALWLVEYVYWVTVGGGGDPSLGSKIPPPRL